MPWNSLAVNTPNGSKESKTDMTDAGNVVIVQGQLPHNTRRNTMVFHDENSDLGRCRIHFEKSPWINRPMTLIESWVITWAEKNGVEEVGTWGTGRNSFPSQRPIGCHISGISKCPVLRAPGAQGHAERAHNSLYPLAHGWVHLWKPFSGPTHGPTGTVFVQTWARSLILSTECNQHIAQDCRYCYGCSEAKGGRRQRNETWFIQRYLTF